MYIGKESATLKQKHFIFIWILFSLLFLTACSSLSSEETPPAEPVVSGEEFTPIISATGVIVPIDWASLSMSATGVVDEVLVSADESVTAGQVLVRLQGEEQLQAALSAAQLELASAQSALNDLNENTALMAAMALQDLENSQIGLDNLLNSDMQEASALQAIADAEKAVESAERRLSIVESIADKADIDAAKAQVVLAKDVLDNANDDFEPYANKRENNLVRANLLARQASAQQAYDSAVRKLNALLSSGKEVDKAVARADLATARAQLVDAQREWEQVKDGPNQGDIDLLEAQISKAQREYGILHGEKIAIDELHLSHSAISPDRVHEGSIEVGALSIFIYALERSQPFQGAHGLREGKAPWTAKSAVIAGRAEVKGLAVEDLLFLPQLDQAP